MCAIFGIIGEGNQNILKKMSDCQKYRGPDEQRFFVDTFRNVPKMLEFAEWYNAKRGA